MKIHSDTPGGGRLFTFETPIKALRVAARRVWVYLPPGYEGSKQRYPALYLQDGQNLFDPETSFSGDWGVHSSLDRLCGEGRTKGAIVVGVDNGGAKRWSEYSPWYNGPMRRVGKGKLYSAFLANELKPRIDSLFRTLPGREHTGVGGSSYGGIISFYTLFAFPGVFSRAMVMSPSFWSSGSGAQELLAGASLPADTRLYMDVGTDEGDHGGDYVRDARRYSALLLKKGVKQKLVLDEGATHNEAAWAARFPAAFLWLFGGRRSAGK